jgi:hypothetical protein
MKVMTRKRRWARLGLAGGLVVGWLAAIEAAYYIPHKPFGPETTAGIAAAAVDLAVAAAILAVAGGLGRRLAPTAHPDSLAALALQTSLGLGVCSLAILCVGVVGGLRSWVGWTALVAGLILLRRSILSWLGGWRDIGAELRSGGAFVRGIAALSGIILVAALAEALAPPIHFDALVYHLALPQEFLAHHSIALTPDNPYWGMPLGTEMLYLWAMALGRPQTAAALGWMMGVAALVGVVGLGRGFGKIVAWTAVAALLCGETLATSLGWAYADWLTALHGVAMLIALDAWRTRQDLRWAGLAGVLGGLAFGAKYTAGLALVAGVAFVFAAPRRPRQWKAAAVLVGAGLAAGAPWLLKNLLYSGAPLYPFFGASAWIHPLRQEFFRGQAGGESLWRAVLAPALASLQGVEDAPGYSASIGPLMLGLLPGLLALRRRTVRAVAPLAAFVLVGWAGWGAASLLSVRLAQPRLHYLLFPAWAIVAGLGYQGLRRLRLPGIRFGRLGGALVVLSLTISALNSAVGAVRARSLATVFGLVSPTEYVTSRLGAYALAMQTVHELGPEAVVVSLWEPRGLYCWPTCLPDVWLDRWWEARQTLAEPTGILEAWKEQGITHVLLNRAGMDFIRAEDSRYSSQDWAVFQGLLDGLPPVARLGAGYELFLVPQ